MLKNLSEESKFKIYLALLSLVGLGFILMVTHKYGAGVSSDAARNLATAESLLQGKGFVDMLGGPFVLWPPLYPLLLAGLSWLTTMERISSRVGFERHSLSAQSLAVRLVVLFDLQREIALRFHREFGFIVFALHASHLCQCRLRTIVRYIHADLLFRGGAIFQKRFAFHVVADVCLGGIGDSSTLSRRDLDRRWRTRCSFQGRMAGIASSNSSRADSGSAHRVMGSIP